MKIIEYWEVFAFFSNVGALFKPDPFLKPVRFINLVISPRC